MLVEQRPQSIDVDRAVAGDDDEEVGADEEVDFAALHRLGRLVVLGGLDDDEQVVAETLELRPLMSAQRRRDTEPFQLQRVGERTHLVGARALRPTQSIPPRRRASASASTGAASVGWAMPPS
jgi:hypothetical protein